MIQNVTDKQRTPERGKTSFLLQVVVEATAKLLSGLISCLILLLHISWYEHFNAFLQITLRPLPSFPVKLSELVTVIVSLQFIGCLTHRGLNIRIRYLSLAFVLL